MTALRVSRAGFSDRESDGPLWARLDHSILFISVVLFGIGLTAVFSATRGVVQEGDVADTSFVVKQLIFAVAASAASLAVISVDYRKATAVAPALYGIGIVLLLGLFVAGQKFNGATSWYSFGFITLQPSELMKLAIILSLASWFSHNRDEGAPSFSNLLIALAVAGFPALLVLIQPDYGTVMVYVAITLGMVVIAGTRLRHLALVVGVGIMGMWAMAQTGVLTDEQLSRFTAFTDSASDDRYNVNQSEIAIGNGGVTGQGLFNGSQTRGSFVPEKESDFIFSVIGEEFGLLGGAVLLLLYGLLLVRIWRVAHLADTDYGRLISVGVFSMFLFQAFQSIGMNMGMMPVTGIPLPLISYGGSSLLTTFLAIALVENVHAHRLR